MESSLARLSYPKGHPFGITFALIMATYTYVSNMALRLDFEGFPDAPFHTGGIFFCHQKGLARCHMDQL